MLGLALIDIGMAGCYGIGHCGIRLLCSRAESVHRDNPESGIAFAGAQSGCGQAGAVADSDAQAIADSSSHLETASSKPGGVASRIFVAMVLLVAGGGEAVAFVADVED